ncbi:MAG: SusE domain-containing protein [Flavobacterium haoranii]
MKKILKLSTLALLLFAGVSCENDDQTIATPMGGPELLTPTDGNEYVLLAENASNEVTTLVWNHADYDVQTEINYNVEVALADTDFATIISGGSTNSRYVTWTVEQLNVVMLDLGATPYQATDIDVRIKSSLGANNDLEDYSNTISITVTPYSTDLPKIGVVGNHQGWSPGTSPEIAASAFGETDYEGYVWLDGEFKFIAANASGVYEWGNTDWGDDGSFSGALLEGSQTNCGPNAAGYYRVRANTTTLTYETTLVSWGVIGSATPGGWDQILQVLQS